MKAAFHRYKLSPRVIDAARKIGFKRPTSVQEKVIPLFLQKYNLIVEAPTGTGKTAAYGLPLISHLDLNKRNTQALVLAPTRELALQIIDALNSYFDGDQLKVRGVLGGTTFSESEAGVRSGAHIVVAVPGRLRDVMSHLQSDLFWKDIKYLIMDEGDKLLETGFLRDFETMRGHLRNRIQFGFFSATISEEAEKSMRELIQPVKVVRLKPQQVLKNIKFQSLRVTEGQRSPFLAGLLKQEQVDSALIFCSRREEVQTVTGFLRNSGFQAESYYGSMEQQERGNILQRFKEGHIHYLVASDLAARGLDILDLPAVINLSIPGKYDYYLHRVGRTGRAGRKGRVFNFLTSEADQVYLSQYHDRLGLPSRKLEVDPIKPDELRVATDEKYAKYHLSRGKKDKVRKGDVLGFLVNEAGVSADQIGTITIYDSYSIVDMPVGAYKALSKKNEKLKIKGLSLKMRPYSLDEQEKRARAVKKQFKGKKNEKK
jgi:superfamily II DNA/RNA helicase